MSSTQFLNAEEVARYLNVGKNTVYDLVKSGKLVCYHVGRKMRFTIEDADAYLASTRGASVAQTGQAAVSPVPASAPTSSSDDGSSDGSELAAAAAFDAPNGTAFIIAGADRAADVLAGALSAEGVAAKRLVRGGYTGLVNLYAGEADAAVIDLFDQNTNSWNVPYVRNLAPGASVIVFRLLTRPVGFIVAPGNPKRLRTWGGLLHEGVQLANRTKGSGARVLLDEKLRALDARAENIAGYGPKTFTGVEAARRVGQGMVDVTLGHQGDIASAGADVDFVPLQAGSVDLVVRKTPETRPVIRKLKALLATEALRAQLAVVPGNDASRLGVIVYES